MTTDQKLAVFERVHEIVEEQMKLESHYTTEQRSAEAIDFTRVNAYIQIVNAVIGQGTMK